MTTENFDYYQAEQDISYYKQKITLLVGSLGMLTNPAHRVEVEKAIDFAAMQILRIRLAMVLVAEHNLTLLN